jgi:hypothetical protein
MVTINPAKSEILNTANRLECPKVKIDNNEITEIKEAKNLGLIRKAKNKLNIEDSKSEDMCPTGLIGTEIASIFSIVSF